MKETLGLFEYVFQENKVNVDNQSIINFIQQKSTSFLSVEKLFFCGLFVH
jgi:hypothetical protein